MPLKKLIVENFQSIKERTEFDLNKITFLFGPNSAGKSVVDDALSLAFAELNWPNHKDIRSSADFGHFRELGSGRDTMLSRSWRWSGNRYAEFCAVGLGGVFDAERESYLVWGSNEEIPSFHWRWELRWQGEDTDTDQLDRPTLHRVSGYWSFSVDGDILVDAGGIYMTHPVLADLGPKLDLILNDSVPPNSDLTYRDGVLRNNTCQLPDDEKTTIRSYLFRPGLGSSLIESLRFDSPLDEVLATIAEKVDRRVSCTRSPAMEPMKISASRMIPKPKDLTFVFHDPMAPETCLLGNTVRLDLGNDEQIVTGQRVEYAQGMELRNWDMFRELASGYFCNLGEVFNEDPETFFESRGWFERVNHLLSNFLFIENGYQIDGEHAFILSSQELNRVAKGNNLNVNSEWVGAQVIVTLMLRDAQGHKLHFNEVGSGIGYALPILISLVSGCNALNQQPELHLHPALQSQLGDLYLHTAQDDRYVVVETHSEHLLLRVLRRIRQRSSGKLDDQDYKFATPSDVSVYYFEPQGDGETKVRRIRISPEGDFLDPWPGGFFEERYEDLFYE